MRSSPRAAVATVVVASLAVFHTSAGATDDPFEQTNGVYVGHVMGRAADNVTIELRGTSLVILDPKAIAVLTADRWQLAGPGGKGGDFTLKADGEARAMASRAGETKKAPKTPKVALQMRLWPEDKRAVLCVTDPNKPGTKITRVPPSGAAEAPGAGVTCFDLVRVYSPLGAPPRGDFPAPVPDIECMRECRQQNMMRAVGPEVIEADCRAACRNK
jgi:hypothetical protein